MENVTVRSAGINTIQFPDGACPWFRIENLGEESHVIIPGGSSPSYTRTADFYFLRHITYDKNKAGGENA